jgi:hypothetical protein
MQGLSRINDMGIVCICEQHVHVRPGHLVDGDEQSWRDADQTTVGRWLLVPTRG